MQFLSKGCLNIKVVLTLKKLNSMFYSIKQNTALYIYFLLYWTICSYSYENYMAKVIEQNIQQQMKK